MKGMAVFAIIEELPANEGKILLVHDRNKPPPAMWKLPGGKVEIGESPETALYRELKEEIGVNILSLADKDVIFEKDLENHIFRVYKARYYGGEIVQCQKEIEWIKIFSFKEIKQMLIGGKILPKHAMALKQYLI